MRVFVAAGLARETLGRGLRLNAPEAIAIACDEMHLAARGGASIEEVIAAGRASVRPDDLMDGVADLAPRSGSRSSSTRAHGSSCCVGLGPGLEDGPGAIRSRTVRSRSNEGRGSSSRDEHLGPPVRISSHFPFDRSNPRLTFDRAAARGTRLDIAGGDTVRWAPGEDAHVDLVGSGPRPVPDRDVAG